MYPGLLNKLVVISILVGIPAFAKAQFLYRFEMGYNIGIFTQHEKISNESDPYEIEYARQGIGQSFNLAYNFNNKPLKLKFSMLNISYSKHEVGSSMRVEYENQELKSIGGAIEVEYIFFQRSTFKPFASVGISYQRQRLTQKDIQYTYTESEDGFIPIRTSWGYNEVESTVPICLGVPSGLGIQTRISDNFGLFGQLSVTLSYQTNSDWLGNFQTTTSIQFGAFLRFSKRLNPYL